MTQISKNIKPLKSLTKGMKRHAGRNNRGRITVRHQGGGHKRRYRIVDFLQKKMDIPAVVEYIEYDPYRTAFIARIRYRDGERQYILAPHELKIGQQVITSLEAPFESGNRTILKRIPSGTFVHNVELTPGRGGQLGRSAGSSLKVLANEDGYTHLKMPSSEVRRVRWDGYASMGQVSNPQHSTRVIGKAGRSRWLGIRPTVRGTAMNPVDHPYGGGEGKTQRGTKRPKTKWGKVTGGHRTRRKNKPSNRYIIKRRKKR